MFSYRYIQQVLLHELVGAQPIKARHSFTDSLMLVPSAGSLLFAWALFFVWHAYEASTMQHDPPVNVCMPLSNQDYHKATDVT